MNDSLLHSIADALQNAPVSKAGYSHLPEAYFSTERRLQASSPTQAHEFNRALYRLLLDKFSLSDARITLPASVVTLYEGEITRLTTSALQNPDFYFRSDNDPFIKDMALLLHRLVPCGAEYFYPFSGIPRSLAVRGGMAGLIRFTAAIASTRGLYPLLGLHMHPDVIDRFTPDGWLATYENLADVLEENPQFLGVQSFSWFLDPALEDISPHLAYLSKVPQQCGAYILYAGAADPVNSGALKTSRRRRHLAQTGQYVPKTYARIWPKKSLIKRLWRTNTHNR